MTKLTRIARITLSRGRFASRGSEAPDVLTAAIAKIVSADWPENWTMHMIATSAGCDDHEVKAVREVYGDITIAELLKTNSSPGGARYNGSGHPQTLGIR